jgi:exosome complex RNA-binding protein Rrp42 (RNase PH superfamily)
LHSDGVERVTEEKRRVVVRRDLVVVRGRGRCLDVLSFVILAALRGSRENK